MVMWDEEARDQILRYLASLSLDPLKPPVLELRPYEDAPSDDQRGYYHTAVLPALCDWSGYRKHEMDKFLHEEFGPKVHMEVGGRKRDVSVFTMSGRGSKRVVTVFLDMVIQWANDQGVFIPPPSNRRER